MAVPTEHVQPGALIRADLMNAIVDALAELDGRVATLELATPATASHAVKITSVSPLSPRVGDEMTVIGQNFDISTHAAVAHIGSTIVPSFKPESTDTKLVFTIPNVPDVAAGPKQVQLKVSNFATDATRVLTLQPKIEVFQGAIDIQYVDTTPATPKAGGTALVRFAAKSTGSPAVTVGLSGSVSTGWTGVQVVDDASPPQPIASHQITIPALGERDFALQVPIPAATASGTAFTLTVEAAGQGVSTSRIKQLTVGQPAPVEDPDIQIDFRSADGSALVGSVLRVPAGASTEVGLAVQFAKEGKYDIKAALEPITSKWTVATDAPEATPDTPSVEIESTDIGTDGKTNWLMTVGLTAASATSDQPKLHVTAKRHGGTLTRELTYQLLAVNS